MKQYDPSYVTMEMRIHSVCMCMASRASRFDLFSVLAAR